MNLPPYPPLTRVMLDLETLGTKPGSVILSIGAVTFTPPNIISRFYLRIDPKSCTDIGMTIDPATVQWWLTQEEAARMEVAKPTDTTIQQALQSFSNWVGPDCGEMWGNGAAFDNVLLAAAYDMAGMQRPWSFRADRCYRTVRHLHPDVAPVDYGTLHNAVDDAEAQALTLMKILSATES